jgi:hypothetical protein
MKRNKKIIAGIMCMLALGIVGTMASKLNLSASSSTGWVQSANGSWNYNKVDGSKSTGWVQDGADWYYFWSNGEMATGWVQSSGTWYYLTSNGAMATNTVVDGCYLNSTGAWTTRPSGDIYTGAEIKDKVRSLGFLDKNGGMALNPNGVGRDQDDYMAFSTLSGTKDMSLTILCTNSEVEQKVPIILNWILPTQGKYLNSVLEDSNLKSQTLELDGRTITINSQQRFLTVTFGPIK